MEVSAKEKLEKSDFRLEKLYNYSDALNTYTSRRTNKKGDTTTSRVAHNSGEKLPRLGRGLWYKARVQQPDL